MNKLEGRISFSLIKVSMFFSVFLTSCRHEESSNTETFIENRTPYTIKIQEYSNVSIDKEITINSMERKLVLSKSTRGKDRGYSYASYLSFNDSTSVIYDDSIQIIHYSYKESKKQPVGIQYNNARSLYNGNSYIRKIAQEDKFKINNEYTYTFTNQDYLNAKNK